MESHLKMIQQMPLLIGKSCQVVLDSLRKQQVRWAEEAPGLTEK